jgi:hypothetical protein
MRYALIAIALLCTACSLFDEYGPCPSSPSPSPTPGPGAPPGPDDPLPPGDYADRYRKLSDGTVCMCGPYDVGCYETPEGADGSKACSYGPEGQICDDYTLPTPPSGAVPDAEELSEPVKKWRCPYRWRRRAHNDWSDDERIRQAQHYRKANIAHFQWCAQKSDDYWEYKCSDCDTTPVP